MAKEKVSKRSLLSLYLEKAGVTSGLLNKNTSHSGLENLKKLLLGQELFHGGEQFLIVGRSIHERWLEEKKEVRLKPADQVKVVTSVNSLIRHKGAMSLRLGATTEEKLYVEIHGVQVAFILDIHNKPQRVGADLKTSGTRCLSEFIAKAKEYGYFRQAKTYMIAADLLEFYFIVVTKQSTPQVFIFRANDYPEELAYAAKELEFLLYFYKHYGNLIKIV